MQKAKITAYRSDGKTFCYESDEWQLRKIEGIDFAEIETSKEARGVGDGDLITGQRRLSREIILTARPLIKSAMGKARAQAQSFHNIQYTYALVIEYMGNKRIAKGCRITDRKLPTGNVFRGSHLVVIFLSPFSDLFEDKENQSNLSKFTPRWKSPHAYIHGKPLIYATEEKTDSIVIDYEGSSETPIQITIAAEGYVNGLTVEVGANKAKLNIELKKGDLVIIDGSKSYALLNDKIIVAEKTNNYDFRKLKLQIGDNKVSVKSDSGDAYKTDIKYTGRYDGI